MDKTLGLYLHIPFCRQKCIYCDFYSLSDHSDEMDRYLSALCREASEMARLSSDRLVDSIYVGGGTPTLLGGARLASLLNHLRSCFHISDTAEITVEANPESATLDTLHTLYTAGANRLSIGVQSADDKELSAIGRIHTFSQAEQAVRFARMAGFQNLSLDLIYGLPSQTLSGWEETLRKVIALAPEHLSCYGLKVEKGTPLWHRQEQLSLPDDDLQADCYLRAVEILTAAGYLHYEISNFGRPGFFSRHNLKYWQLGEYIGLGPSAHSDFHGRRTANPSDLSLYLRRMEDMPFVPQTAPLLTPEDRAAEYVMLGLRTRHGISADEYTKWNGHSFSPAESLLLHWSHIGLTTQDSGRWHLSAPGMLLSNSLIAELLAVLENG